MTRQDDELTPEERAALARLPRDATPRAGLEQETVAALMDRGLLRRPRRRLRLVLALAASVLLFAGGLALGRLGRESALPADQRPRFVLLLYEGPAYQEPATADHSDRVREYSAWAHAERAEGMVEGGEKLKDGEELVVEPDGSARAMLSGPDESRLAGYFLIRAADQQSALAIARTCPHSKYGGSIVIREIEPT